MAGGIKIGCGLVESVSIENILFLIYSFLHSPVYFVMSNKLKIPEEVEMNAVSGVTHCIPLSVHEL